MFLCYAKAELVVCTISIFCITWHLIKMLTENNNTTLYSTKHDKQFFNKNVQSQSTEIRIMAAVQWLWSNGGVTSPNDRLMFILFVKSIKIFL